MSAWKVRGTFKGRSVVLGFRDGELWGDELAVAAIEARSGELEGIPVGPVGGPYTFKEHARNVFGALMLAEQILTDRETLERDGDGRGDLDDDVPDGAII